MAAVYLDALNENQRRAVEHGVELVRVAPAEPLLVIAGAGSGKTNTLANRVGHLFLHGKPRIGDRHVYADRTRFIPKSLLGHFERVTWLIAPPLAAAVETSPALTIDAGARLKSMWQ